MGERQLRKLEVASSSLVPSTTESPPRRPMSRFVGGSAGAMAREIAEGFIIVTQNTLRRFAPEELRQLQFEIDRLLTALRAEQSPTDDPLTVQKRNRKISRLTQVAHLIQALLQQRRG